LFAVDSHNEPGVSYRVVIPTDTGLVCTCTCPNFRYHGKDGPCKHIDEVLAIMADDGYPELLRRGGGVPVDGSLVAEAFEAGFKMGQRGFVH
jgi:hypothetical protein